MHTITYVITAYVLIGIVLTECALWSDKKRGKTCDLGLYCTLCFGWVIVLTCWVVRWRRVRRKAKK